MALIIPTADPRISGSAFMPQLRAALEEAAISSQWTTVSPHIHFDAGNVGIGTNSPTALLHIKGAPPSFIFETTSTTGKGRVTSVVGNWLGNTVNNSFDGANWNLDDTSVAGWIQKLDARSAHDRFEIARLSVGSNPRTYTPLLTLLGSGNLGINTVTPRKQIDSLSTSQAQLRLTYTDHATTPVCVDFLANSSGNLVITPRAASAAGVNITLGKNGHMAIAGAALDIFANGGFVSSIGLSHDEEITADISEMPKVAGLISYIRLNPSTNQPTPGSGSTGAPNGAEAYALRGLCEVPAASAKVYNEIYGAEGIALFGGTNSLITGFGVRGEYTHFGTGTTTTAAGVFANFRTGTGATGTVTDALGLWSRVNLEHALNVNTARCIIADFRNTGSAAIAGSVTLIHAITPIISTGTIAGNLYGLRIQDMSAFGARMTGTLPTNGNMWNIKSFGANSINLFEGRGLFGTLGPTASANHGSLSVGAGPFDGSTSGFYVGSASGTHLAINAPSGYAGDLANWQVAGVSKFKVTSAGDVAVGALGSVFTLYNSGGTAGDSLKLQANNLGASFGTQNLNASGFSGIEYIDNAGTVKMFSGYSNGGTNHFRFNVLGVPLRFLYSGTIRIEADATGLGFFAATPVAKPTGVAVTAAGIHAALVSLGLIAP